MANTVSLLSSKTRVETPFIKVTIGSYTFGVYDKVNQRKFNENGKVNYNVEHIKYPNFVQSLNIQKINGTVNTYTLNIVYPITEHVDPNFFEKVFSSVSKTRKIVFSYGDLSAPSFCFKDEEALITNIKSNFGVGNSSISYIITAVSSAVLLKSGGMTFPKRNKTKPSDVIKQLLKQNVGGILDLYYGMRNSNLVETKGLIMGDDKPVDIDTKTNISILDYLYYLISMMTNISDTRHSVMKDTIYSLVTVDDVSGEFEGPYFKIVKVNKNQYIDNLTTYHIDVGYPSENIVTNLSIDDNESYSILYDYNKELYSEDYSQRINDDGQLEYVYAPLLTSSGDTHTTDEDDRTWWTNITQYPIKATLTLKGLLRPAILMTHIKLNVWFYGQKHISSGTYIITKQVDDVSGQGFRTTLSITRVKGDKIN